MADEKTAKTVLEREYTINLRRKYINVPKYQRTKKAIKTVREYLAKHMKSEDVKLGTYLNLDVWKHGGKNPPHHITVIAKKDDTGAVTAEIKGAPVKKTDTKADDKKDAKADAKPAEAPAKVAEKKPEVKEAAPKTDAPKAAEAKPAAPKETPKAESKPAPAKPAPAKEAPKADAKPAAKPAEKAPAKEAKKE